MKFGSLCALGGLHALSGDERADAISPKISAHRRRAEGRRMRRATDVADPARPITARPRA